jgi:hypothetical protein
LAIVQQSIDIINNNKGKNMKKCDDCQKECNIDDLNALGSIVLCDDCHNEIFEECNTSV